MRKFVGEWLKFSRKIYMKAKITVTLKEGVLDPQGRAVMSALNQMDGESVNNVRIGKFIEIEVNEDDPQTAEDAIKNMCDKLLANPVTENYKIDLLPE